MSQYPNVVAVTHLLLKSHSVKHSLTGLTQKLEEHPDYPSMMAISDCLTEWQVANEAIQIPNEAYKEMELPFIAHFNANGGIFILVSSVADDKITYSDEKHDSVAMDESEFLKKWNGIILRAEANEESREPEYHQNKWKDLFQSIKIPALVVVLLAGIVLSIYSSASELSLCYYFLLLINLLGIGVTSLLLITSIDNNNPLVQNLCSLGNKNGCNAILKTDAAKVTNWLSWSEVGFFYFTGSAIALLISPSALLIITGLNLLALPYTVYSIGYQYKYKNWCMLCCAVQGLLLLANVIALVFGLSLLQFSLWPFSFGLLAQIAFSFLLPIVSWYMLKSFFMQAVQYKPLKQQLKKFKYNGELFNQVLKNQPRFAIGNEMMPVTLGNPNAETVITMISNPFCRPCAKAHKTIDEWLKYRDDLQLKIIFITADHDDDEKTKVSRHIGALTTLKNADLLEKALNDWYAQDAKQYETWAQKYPIVFNGEMNKVTEKQKTWCDMAEITFTPTILVNGYKLPEPYRLEDIKYLLS